MVTRGKMKANPCCMANAQSMWCDCSDRKKEEKDLKTAIQLEAEIARLRTELAEAEKRGKTYRDALTFVSNIRNAYPPDHSRHLLLKMCEREAKEALSKAAEEGEGG